MKLREKRFKPGSFLYVCARISQNPMAITAVFIIATLFILSFVSPLFLPYGINKMDMMNAYCKPNAQHWFGCDELGRDILARILYGARFTLSVGFLSVAISLAGGILLGATAGYFGGVVETLIMRFLDIMTAFPNILLAIAISATLGKGLDKCIIALGVAGIPQFARMLRGNILSVRGQEYIEAAASINCTTFRIVMKHVVPNAISPLIVSASMAIANAGLNAAMLSFIGLGVQPPTPEWGAMIAASRSYILDSPHMVLFPGIFIMISVICLNLIGDAIRDALDPRLKN